MGSVIQGVAQGLPKQLRKPSRPVVICGVLMALLGAYWVKSRHTPGVAAASDGSTTTTAPAAKPAAIPMDVRVTVPDQLRRDPFSSTLVFPPKVEAPVEKPAEKPLPPPPDPTELAMEAAKQIHLSAIVMSQQPVAIVNGVAYRVGDNLLGFQVKQISPRSIVLERDGVRVQVSVQ